MAGVVAGKIASTSLSIRGGTGNPVFSSMVRSMNAMMGEGEGDSCQLISMAIVFPRKEIKECVGRLG